MADQGNSRQTGKSAMNPPPGGAIVRMYRIGHGDCFLIAFPARNSTRPVFVLIDCGYKPGSPAKLAKPTDVKDIAADILATTQGKVDIVVVTHEHQDHLNGFTPNNFPGLKIGEVWFAWTEDPADEIAERLRKRFNDRLLELIGAGVALRANKMEARADRVQDFLEMELGEDPAPFHAVAMAVAAKDPAASANKKAMKFLRDCCDRAPRYLLPHGKPLVLAGAADVRAFVLGPPRDIDKIDDLNPEGDESFGNDDHRQALAAGSAAQSAGSPFPRRHVIPLEGAFGDPEFGDFFKNHFGEPNVKVDDAPDSADAPSNAPWRRIDAAAAEDADLLAIAMNNATNNSSLVLAFELSKGGKTLLFAADAQAGNWRSWADSPFNDGDKEIAARDLLARCALYKVGHHGSHNATLAGGPASPHPCLAWMGLGEQSGEFVGMITAVEEWAHQKPKPDWNHPFPPIKAALEKKARMRVLQTDADAPDDPPAGVEAATWRAFRKRLKQTPLYFELTIEGAAEPSSFGQDGDPDAAASSAFAAAPSAASAAQDASGASVKMQQDEYQPSPQPHAINQQEPPQASAGQQDRPGGESMPGASCNPFLLLRQDQPPDGPLTPADQPASPRRLPDVLMGVLDQAEIADDGSVFLMFGAVAGDWLQAQLAAGATVPSDPAANVQFYASMPLYLLEVRYMEADVLAILGPAWINRPIERALDALEGVWVRIALADGGTAAALFDNLFGPLIQVGVASIEPAASDAGQFLDSLDPLDPTTTPEATEQDIENALNSASGFDEIAVYDVGQGSANGLVSNREVVCYFDFGGGAAGNAGTFPPLLKTFCQCNKPPIILSHWDHDHWSSEGRDTRVHSQTWIAPRQVSSSLKRAPHHSAFIKAILGAGGAVLVWPSTLTTKRIGQLEISLCTGATKNTSGLALEVYPPPGVSAAPVLMPADAGYGDLRMLPASGQHDAILCPHHGGRSNLSPMPSPPATVIYQRLIYSYGWNNTYKHPLKTTYDPHHNAKWLDGRSGITLPCPPPHIVRNTEDRSAAGLGHIGFDWTTSTSVSTLACAADLDIQQK